MDDLLATIERETELVRAGRLTEAAALSGQKTELSQLYMAIAQRLKNGDTGGAQWAAADIEALRRQHDLFQALLQVNLTVLATAHAVSEGIMRGVHDELARKAAPSTYGASGRPRLRRRAPPSRSRSAVSCEESQIYRVSQRVLKVPRLAFVV